MRILVPLAIVLIGVSVTVVTYSVTPPGGHYIIAWGAIVFGGWRLFKALAGLDDD